MYDVLCRAANGREKIVRVSGFTTGNAACTAALKQLEDDEPDQGWLAVRALEV